MRDVLVDGRTIIWSGLAFLALTIGFGIWIQAYDLQMILDELSNSDQIRRVVAEMSAEQRAGHWWMTLVLDYAYPLAYGSFFAGLALRNFDKAGLWIAIPAFLSVPADMIENTIQLFILSGDEALIGVKTIVTPIKLVSFVLAAIIALFGIALAAYQRLAGAD
ncbi:MAG: hypothetical protein AAFY82_03520 [Pseudomonadota bacterium]